MKIFQKFLLALILFLLSNSIVNAETAKVDIPISSNGFLKEYWDPKYIWSAGYLSMGNDNSIYKDYRTRILIMLKLAELRDSGIGIGDITRVDLNLWYYHTEKNSPSIYNFYIHPWDGSTPKYIYWPDPPAITEHTLERSIEKKSGVKEIDITQIVKEQLRDPEFPQGIQMNLIEETQLAIWFYSARCTRRELYYYPQCEPHMVPSVTAFYETTPPTPVLLTDPEIVLEEPEPLSIKWIDEAENYYSLEVSETPEFDQILISTPYSSSKEYTLTPDNKNTLYFRVKNLRDIESKLVGISDTGSITFEEKGSDNAPFNPMTETPIQHPPPVKIPVIYKDPKLGGENEVGEEVKGEKTVNNEPQNDLYRKIRNPYPTCIKIESIFGGDSIVCQAAEILINNLERVTPNLINIELIHPNRIKLISVNNYCRNALLSSLCRRSTEIIDPPILYTAEYDKREIDLFKISKTKNTTLMIKSSSEKLNGKIRIFAHYFISGNFVTFQSDEREIPDLLISNLSGVYNFPFTQPIGVTQWHGYTAYSKPHTGIDFGADNEEIYALADGIVYSTGYDNYFGMCNSGGNYINIKHNDGSHSVYMHLEGDSIDLKKGEIINKGEFIARSGNSGAYNCQPLNNHLHLETRETAYQKDHTNPVPLLGINWDLVETLDHRKFPGRLTGENPHPTW